MTADRGGGFRGGRGGGRGAPRGGPRGGGGFGRGAPRGGRGAPRGGRGGGRGGGGRGGIGAGSKVLVVPHDRFKGVFILRGKDDAIVTKNMNPGESVYNEKRVTMEVSAKKQERNSQLLRKERSCRLVDIETHNVFCFL